MKLWLLIIKAHRPPTAVGNSAWTGRKDRQGGKGRGRLLTDGSEFHMRSASWGTWLSGPLGRPCWLTLTPLSQAFPFLPESVIVCLPAHPVCFLEAGDVPANHGSCPGRSQLLALWSAGVQQIDFSCGPVFAFEAMLCI